MSRSIFAPRRIASLLAADAMNVSRDPMLIFACVLSLLPSTGLWLARDAIDLAGRGAGIAELSAYFVPLALLLAPFLIGWVTGFLLIEDRDDGPLLALDVTPVGKEGFLAYRLTVSVILAAAISLVALQLLLPSAPLWLKLVILVVLPANTAVSAVAILALARNKVEGLAITKIVNLATIAPFAAIIPSPLRLVAGVVPTYWLGELLGLSGEAAPLPLLSAALLLVTHAIAVIIGWHLFRKRAG